MKIFFGGEVFTPGIIVTPETPAVVISLWPCLVCWRRWYHLQLHLTVVHGHSHLFQLRHYRCVWSVKYCIDLCQSLQIVALHLHSLDYIANVVNRLVILFWRVRRYTKNILYHCGVSPFSFGCYSFPILVMGSVKETPEVRPCLMVSGLTSPLSDFLIKHCRLCQKGDPFW